MKSTNRPISLAGILAVLAVTLASTVPMSGQDTETVRTKGVPWDWTHHHLVFSSPPGAADASDAARLRIASDPRYIMQQRERGVKAVDAPLNAPRRAETAAEPGLDPSAIPDPLAPENLLRGSGRGIFLIRSFMDEVHFRQLQPGTELTLIKHLGTAR